MVDNIVQWPSDKPNHHVCIKGWRTWEDQICKLIGDNEEPTILEVGCWFGKTTKILAERYPKSKIFVIDTFEGGPEHQPGKPFWQPELDYLLEQFMVNLWEHRHQITILHCLSHIGIEQLQSLIPDPLIIYIDAGHEYEYVTKDITTALNFKTSIICGDDYECVKKPNGVRKAVDEMASKHNLTLKHYERFWWYE